MAKGKKRKNRQKLAFLKEMPPTRSVSPDNDFQFGLNVALIKKDLARSLLLSFLAVVFELVIYWRLFS